MQESLAEKEFVKRGELIITNLAHSAKLGVYSENKRLLETALHSATVDADVAYVLIYNNDRKLIASAGPNIISVSSEPLEIPVKIQTKAQKNVATATRRVSYQQLHVIDYISLIPFRVQALPDEELLGSLTSSLNGPTSDHYENIGYVRLGMSMASLANTEIAMLKLWGGLVVAIILVCALIILLLSRRITKPINRLTQGAEKIAQGQLDEMIPVTTNDEIGQLAATFNSMAKALQGNIEQKLELLEEVQSLNLHLEERINNRTAELQERTTELEEASRHKSEFLANMSHELRTPLNAIIGYSEMLEEDAEDAGLNDFVADLQKVQSAGRHLLLLINDMLDLSKIEAGHMELLYEYFSVKAIIVEVLQTIEPLAKKNANQLTVTYLTPVDQMECDPIRVRQCLVNLLSNACKFTQNGRIAIEIETLRRQDGEWILFRISDTGIGIPEDKIEHIFDAFRQADASTTRNFGGTGLGLAICQKFCAMLGGKVTVTSQIDVGSTFTISLPTTVNHEQALIANDSNGDQPIAELTLSADHDSQLVLVIDDDPAARELMTRHLMKDGFAVKTCDSGLEGLALAKTLSPIAIILDILMPNMDGWDVLKALKSDEQLSEIPVVMVSMIDDRSTGYALGTTDYLTKPVDRDQLSTILNQYSTNAGNGSILLVEDDPDTSILIQRCCETQGWKVQTAENGLTALEKLKRIVPDLIVLDLMMPEMDGFEFVNRKYKRHFWLSCNVPNGRRIVNLEVYR